jgi:hypothetical protein
MVYSPRLGEIAEEIRQVGIPVVDKLEQIAIAPDIIHGHHYVQTLSALLHFPVPGIFVCHDRLAWHDHPPKISSLMQYVAVDENCLDRLIVENGIPTEKTQVVLNAVDLDRFLPKVSLPNQIPSSRPKRALVFSNYANQTNYLPVLRQACEIEQIELDVIGEQVGNLSSCPQKVLPDYDLVFAKARCALEAIACGCAVILCDTRGLGQMVTADNLAEFRRFNFGMRLLQRPITLDPVLAEIRRFNPSDRDLVSQATRASAGVDQLAQQLIGIYEAAIAAFHASPDRATAEQSCAAALTYLESQIWQGRFWQQVSQERSQVIQQLEQVAADRLQVIQQLHQTAEERLQVIHQLHQTAEERLQVIHQLTEALEQRSKESELNSL